MESGTLYVAVGVSCQIFEGRVTLLYKTQRLMSTNPNIMNVHEIDEGNVVEKMKEQAYLFSKTTSLEQRLL